MTGNVPITDSARFADHLHAVGVRPGMNLVVHSKLISFGRLEGGPTMILDGLRRAVGDEATLIFPSYTFDTATTPYDPRRSPSTNVGLLSEIVRAMPHAVRSLSPIHSHVGLGPLATILDRTPPTASLGPQSDFESLEAADFHLLLLGCRFNEGCTFLHHMEAVAEVPYRHWRPLARRIVPPDGGDIQDVTCRYFARNDGAPQSAFDAVVPPLRQSGVLGEAKAPLGASFLVALGSLRQTALSMLRENPYALVLAPPQGTPHEQ